MSQPAHGMPHEGRNWPPERLFTPLQWQIDAIERWKDADRSGIVEAVTGSGKSYAGLEAIHDTYSEYSRLSPLIVVPTIAIMYQWRDKLVGSFRKPIIGLIGDDHDDCFSQPGVFVLVGVINSVVRRLPKLFEHTSRSSMWRTLLIADECHHYAEAPVWSTLTKKWKLDFVLGLSATMEMYEVEGLGRIIYEYSFTDAHRDDLIPPFELINVSVPLTPHEQEQYGKLTTAIGDHWRSIMEIYGKELATIPDERFFRTLQRIMKRGAGHKGEWDPTIRRFLVLVFKRAAILYTAERKLIQAERLVRMLVNQGRKKVLVFFERIESADVMGGDLSRKTARGLQERLSDDVGGEAVRARLYHSGLQKKSCARELSAFASDGPSALLACRALDEGIDLPDVDAVVLASSTKSQRQRIQRIGRALRRGDESKKSLIISLHVGETTDEEICSRDHEVFGKVATIHKLNEHTIIDFIASHLT